MSQASFELMRERAFNAGINTSLTQEEISALAKIKMGS
jgi:hypothetical protein